MAVTDAGKGRYTGAMAAPDLPTYWTSYINREEEQAEIARLLCQPATRLVTVTGPAGCGKSRLALHVAADMADEYPDGVCWVDLAPITEPSLFPQAIAAVLGVREEPGRRLMQTVMDYLRPRRLLLVVDNCSHLIGGRPSRIDPPLAACPHLRILATSREALGVVGEQVVRLRPLDTPDPQHLPSLDALPDYPAIRLFVERARQTSPTFTLTPQNAPVVAQICRQLDGLPLGIELAAARTRVLSVEQIAARLQDRLTLLQDKHAPAERHSSLQAALDWSYAQLTPAEAALFRRLSVFAGDFALDSVERVCPDPDETSFASVLPPDEVLEALVHLIDKSLVEVQGEQGGAVRYRLLSTICAYAREKLKEAGERDVFRRRHAAFFLGWLESTAAELTDDTRIAWLSRVETEYDNLRDSLDWFINHADVENALSLALALSTFWEIRGYVREGRREWNRVIALVETAAGSASADVIVRRARALDSAAALAHLHSDYAEARRLYEAGLTLKREMGDRHGAALTLHSLSIVVKDQGDYPHAEALCRESLAILRDLGDRRNTAHVLETLGLLAHLQGDMGRAARLYTDSLDLFEDLGDRRGAAHALSNLSLLARNQGDYARAQALSERSLALRREMGDTYGEAISLANLGLIALFQGNFRPAAELQAESLALFEEIQHRWGIALLKTTLALTALYQGDADRVAEQARESRNLFEAMGNTWGVAMAVTTLALVAARQGRLERAKALAREGLSLRHALGDRHGMAESLEALAEAVAAEGQVEQAVVLLGAAAAIRQAIGAPQAPVEAQDIGRWLTPVRRSMGQQTYETALARGAAMSPNVAAAYALASGAGDPAKAPAAEPQTPAADSEERAEPHLRLFGFGAARVYRGDHLVTPKEWTYAKPKELLFFLLSRRVRTRQQIGVMLWPDVSPGQLRNSFHPAVHHLRRVLGGHEWVVVGHDGYSFNRSLPYTYDVETFEANIAEARRLRRSEPTRAIERLREAIALYQGEFLEDITGASEWILLRREELGRLYEEALLTLGELLIQAGRNAEAADTYRLALAHDSLLEEAHRGLMRCLAQLGEHAQAIRQYHNLEALLATELDGAPARETRALFERISRGEEV